MALGALKEDNTLSAYVELQEFITFPRVDEAHRRAIAAQERRHQNFADTGYRAALARDPRMLKVLELAANAIDREQESQFGQTMRSRTATPGEQSGTTEAQLWREAYRLCDEGNPIRNFEWIYGAAAWLCGYNA
jgi:hypothetical protein